MTTQEVTLYVIAPLIGYLLGSIPFAFVIGKAHGIDIRTIGSKNIGATNLGRALGKKFFMYAMLLDAAKGFFPVLSVSLLASRGYFVAAGPDGKPLGLPTDSYPYGVLFMHFPSWIPLLTAIACVLGHNFPLFLKFKGGKGVATSLGVVLGFWPIFTLSGIGALLVFIAVALLFRYISLASIIGVLAFVGFVVFFSLNPAWFTHIPLNDFWPLLAVAALFAALIIFRHRANIGRLLKGTESKIGSSKPRTPPADQPPAPST